MMPEPPDSYTSEALKRLNLNLPPDRYSRVQNLAKKKGTTIAEIVRSALGLMELLEEAKVTSGNRIALVEVNNKGKIVKEYVPAL